MDDGKIVELFFGRSEDALTEAGKKYGAYCRAIAGNVLRDERDAEECVNDAMMQAWDSIPPEKPKSLKAYFAKITRNLAFNRYNEAHAEKRGGGETALVLDELAECIAGEGDALTELESRELGELIRGFVRKLPLRERQIFVRRYFFTEPVKSVAERYGITENGVSVILHRTRSKLKKLLIKEGYYDE